jgi:predicted methyltransferase
MDRFEEREAAAVVAEVAAAVQLQEGSAGVRAVLRAIRDLSPAAARTIGRQAGLPVPLVSAVGGELRRRGLLAADRPARLTTRGVQLVDTLDPPIAITASCSCCAGRGLVIPDRLEATLPALDAMAAAGPAADLTLDQSHCTPATKLRRVLYLLDRGILPGGRLLVLGDDDLVAAALAVVGSAIGRPLTTDLAVVDVSAEVLDYTETVLATHGAHADLVRHDLREPLPAALTRRFDVVLTDPPYTVAGARLFLSRAVEALRPGPGQSVLFCFGPKGPDDTLAVGRVIVDLGLAVASVHRNFNEYLGAGIISGTSHLHHLLTTSSSRPVEVGRYAGPLYTTEQRARPRLYQCLGCATRQSVGPGERYPSVAELKQATCPVCGGSRFRPLHLAPPTQS